MRILALSGRCSFQLLGAPRVPLPRPEARAGLFGFVVFRK